METVASLATSLGLGALLDRVDRSCGRHRMLEHWQQGEFHHDLVLVVPEPPPTIPGSVLVVATNSMDGVPSARLTADCYLRGAHAWLPAPSHRSASVDSGA